MPALASHHLLTAEEYLQAELDSPIRHEFVNGQVYAMTGASLRHNAIIGNLFAAIRMHLKGSPCRVFVEGVKVQIARDNAFYYPDLMVACSEKVRSLPADEYVVSDPLLLIEVHSPSTKAVDRRDKFAGSEFAFTRRAPGRIDRREKLLAYRKLPSLMEYLLVSQSGGNLTLHRRISALHWDEITYSPGEQLELTSIGLRLPYAAVYEDLPEFSVVGELNPAE